MFTVSFDLSGIERGAAAFTRTMVAGVRNAVATAAREGADEARRGSFKDQTGAARKSIDTREIIAAIAPGAETRWEIACRVPYASFLDEGTNAHEIRPKLGRGVEGPLLPGQHRGRRAERAVLHWIGSGGDVFASLVHHPGTHGTGFMGKAALKAEAVLTREVEALPPKAVAAFDAAAA